MDRTDLVRDGRDLMDRAPMGGNTVHEIRQGTRPPSGRVQWFTPKPRVSQMCREGIASGEWTTYPALAAPYRIVSLDEFQADYAGAEHPNYRYQRVGEDTV